MKTRLISPPLLSATLLCWALAPVMAGQPVADSPGETASPDCPPWLSEVRAQREAWEAQRDAVKQEVESRQIPRPTWPVPAPQAVDPAAAPNPAPPTHPSDPRLFSLAPYSSDSRRMESEARREARRQALEKQREERERLRDSMTPFGWDNPWYYRGF